MLSLSLLRHCSLCEDWPVRTRRLCGGGTQGCDAAAASAGKEVWMSVPPCDAVAAAAVERGAAVPPHTMVEGRQCPQQ